MIFVQFLASLALSLSSVNLWSENSWSGNSQSAVQQSTLISSSQDGPVRYYYIAEETEYFAARKICQKLYGDKYALPVIQSEEELQTLNAFLEQYTSPGSEIWVGGIYSIISKEWVWESMLGPQMEESTSFSEYALNLFGSVVPAPPKEFVAYYTMINRSSGRLDEDESKMSRSFVCEYHKPLQWRQKTDVAILLDSSASISPRDYILATNASGRIVSTFAQHQFSRQLGIIFSTDVRVVLPLDFGGAVEEKVHAFSDAPQLKGYTNTGGAILEAFNILMANKRDNTPRTMVVITDGRSNRGPNVTEVSYQAQAVGIKMVVVGIGGDIDVKELESIASSKKLVYMTRNWSQLDQIVVQITSAICSDS